MELPILQKQSCRYVNKRSKSSAPLSLCLYSPITTAALGGERIPSRASIYIYSPLRSASGLLRLRSHDDTVVSRAEVTAAFKCQSARSCSRPPVLDHITSSALPARQGARWRPSCAFSLRQRIPELRGAVEL